MRSYLILLTMGDGRRAVMRGMFATDWAAIDNAYEAFDDELVLAAVPRRVGGY